MNPDTLKKLQDAVANRTGATAWKHLGEGAFSEAYSALVDGVPCCVKFSKEPIADNHAAIKELKAIEEVRKVNFHPFIVSLFGLWTIEGHLVTRWELAERSLKDRLRDSAKQTAGGIPRDELLRYMQQAAEAIDYCHEQGFVHRDIKPANILLVHRTAKVADFGFARMAGLMTEFNSVLGTPMYAPPEAFDRELNSGKGDIYSLAATYCHLASGLAPFDAPTRQGLKEQKERGQFLRTGLSEPEIKVLQRALAGDPYQRFDSATAFVTALMAAWKEAQVDSTERIIVDPRPPQPKTDEHATSPVGPDGIVKGGPRKPNIVNSLGMQFALIKAGEFLMGSPNSKAGRLIDEHQHRVRISRDFLIGIYEVTQNDFQTVMDRNPSHFASSAESARRPVERVSWFDAIELCNKLSEAEGQPPFYTLTDITRTDEGSIQSALVAIAGGEGTGYRLPTEAEWEYAARAGTTTRFFHGDDEARLGEYAWYSSNSGNTTHPVGEKKPNAWGLYDMAGNVWEWCFDAYDAGFYGRESGLAIDPRNDGNAGSPRVLRSGSWNGNARFARYADRYWLAPDIRYDIVGVRFARTP